MLAIEHEFALALEHFVARADQAQLLVARALIEIGADRVDRVAEKDRLDEAQLVIAIGKGVDAVGGDKAKPAENTKAPATSRLPKMPSLSANIWSCT